MGVSIEEGTVTTWLKSAGDTVALGEPICEIATDKVDTEVPCPADGILEMIIVSDGETASVGAALATISVEVGARTTDGAVTKDANDVTANGHSEHAKSAPADPSSGDRTQPSLAAPDLANASPGRRDHLSALAEVARRTGHADRVLASPVARRVAASHGLDLAVVPGTGPAGRIRKVDVLRYIESAPRVTRDPSPPIVTAHAAPMTLPPGYEDVPYEIVPTSRVRRITAEHLIRSRQTAAHMTTEVEVDMHAVTEIRGALNTDRSAGGRAKLSYLPFVVRAAVAALRRHPHLNATFEFERYICWNEVNVGIAVDTPQGLLVPVLRGCDGQTVDAIGDGIADLADRARRRALTSDDLRAGTFTVSNPGSVGAVSAMAIINQPQVAILGIPAIVRRPWVVQLGDGTEAIVPRSIMKLALTFDHRAIDGAEATRCAVLIKTYIESWGTQDYR
jgi:2-oxoglutarate dehydrogenase E2 component (dihydrolipoamide succinyltransferase)